MAQAPVVTAPASKKKREGRMISPRLRYARRAQPSIPEAAEGRAVTRAPLGPTEAVTARRG
jgi:hypothetical protein